MRPNAVLTFAVLSTSLVQVEPPALVFTQTWSIVFPELEPVPETVFEVPEELIVCVELSVKVS